MSKTVWVTGLLPEIGRNIQLKIGSETEKGVIIGHPESNAERRVIRVTRGGYLKWVHMSSEWRYIDGDEFMPVKIQTSEGESMFNADSAPAKGGDRAIVVAKDTNKVVWESTEIFTTTGEGDKQVLGSSKARAKAREVIDKVSENLFSKIT